MRDFVLHNGNVITMEQELPTAEAVVVRGRWIHFVGKNREAFKHASENAEHIDLEKKTLVPGFNDNHIHVISMGDYFSRPKLHGLDPAEIISFLKDFYAKAEPGRTLFALGWDYPDCPNPHKALLDTAFPDNPVVLIQFSGHGMWLNSRALEAHGIDRNTPEPPGGQIVRDEHGEPTGILRDAATRPVRRKRYRRNHRRRSISRILLDRSLKALREAGITSVQDNTWFPAIVRLLNSHKRANLLTCRFSCWFLGRMPVMANTMRFLPFDGEWVSRGQWKYFLDGTFSTRTARLMEPYANEAGSRGIRDALFDRLEPLLVQAVRKKRQQGFHAIGDGAIHEFLDTFERIQKNNPSLRELRIRLEHAQLIHPDDIPRLRDLGILISAQPSAMANPEKDASLLGEERAQRAYAYRSLLDAGVHLSFGSDMPGEPVFDPLLGIHHAANRAGPERITPLEALRCYTMGSAYAEFKENEKGSIIPGKYADLALLSQDPLTIPPEKIKETTVDMTMVGGKIVYRREKNMSK